MLNRNVAIKVLHKAQITGADALRRSKWRHKRQAHFPALISFAIIDFNVSTDGAPYMVMDYLDGLSLEAILDKEGRLPLDRGLHVFIQMCNALASCAFKGDYSS